MWLCVLAIVAAYFVLQWILRSLKVSNFQDKYVFVTGCDTGFGRELAKQLDTLGFHVFAGCLTPDGAKSLAQSCSSRLQTIPLDMSKADSVKDAARSLKEKIPYEKGLWALVNNAGIAGAWPPSEMCTRDEYVSVFDVNFFGLVDLTRLCLPLIRKTRGRIVNMASAAGILAFVAAPYTCSKFAVEAYSDVIRREMSHYGVKVSVLEPGIFKTGIVNIDRMIELVVKARDKATQEVKDFYGPGIVDRYRQRFIAFNEGGSSDISVVVNAYIHAITAKFPKRRYPLGKDCKLIFLPLTYLPSWFTDWFIGNQIYKNGL